MLEIGDGRIRTCEGLSRRSLLTVGGIGTLGLTLADPLRASEQQRTPSRRAGDERNCILVYLNGGPSQYETFDPKPEQPAEIRGPYGAIETNVSGIRISELLPNLSREMHRYSVIRTLTHSFDSHSPRHMMTGSLTGSTTYGAVVTWVRGFRTDAPPFVRLGAQMDGLGGGRLGSACDPVHIPDPSDPHVVLPDYDPPASVPPPRFGRRLKLLEAFEEWRRETDQDATLKEREGSYRRALQVLTSSAVRRAFDLSREPDSLRDAYGANKFGQSCLLARRLLEAGTRYAEIKWFGDFSPGSTAYDAWDVHGAELPGLSRMETQLCPRFDHGMATLLRDLDDHGLLQNTLVVAVGEFGRTPKMNTWGGRDHWPPCQSVLIAGAGVPGGTIFGESDLQGAYPASRPVTLPDFIATQFRLLGLNPNLDDRLRPFVGPGEPMREFVG